MLLLRSQKIVIIHINLFNVKQTETSHYSSRRPECIWATLTFLKVVWIIAWCGHIIMPLFVSIYVLPVQNCGRYTRLTIHLRHSLHVWSLPSKGKTKTEAINEGQDRDKTRLRQWKYCLETRQCLEASQVPINAERCNIAGSSGIERIVQTGVTSDRAIFQSYDAISVWLVEKGRFITVIVCSKMGDERVG